MWPGLRRIKTPVGWETSRCSRFLVAHQLAEQKRRFHLMKVFVSRLIWIFTGIVLWCDRGWGAACRGAFRDPDIGCGWGDWLWGNFRGSLAGGFSPSLWSRGKEFIWWEIDSIFWQHFMLYPELRRMKMNWSRHHGMVWPACWAEEKSASDGSLSEEGCECLLAAFYVISELRRLWGNYS